MKVLGITGGVGAGKSTVLAHLSEDCGARVIQADQVGHLMMEPGRPCYYRIVENFGGGILNGDQTINRGRLSARVFEEPERLEQLNRIIHPAVKEYIIEEIARERRENRVPFTAVEAALLIEDHYELICDEIWYIYADEAVRAERLRKSRGYTEEKIRAILRSQLSDAQFRQASQFVIDNSSPIIENTYEQIDRGLREHGFL